MKIIKPSEVVELKKNIIPQEVFDAFNELIAKNWDGHSATVLQDDVAALIISKFASPVNPYAEHWLDIEDIYRNEGWIVEYDKPGWNEDYSGASFKFSVKDL